MRDTQIEKLDNALSPGMADILPVWIKENGAVVSPKKDSIYTLLKGSLDVRKMRELVNLEEYLQKINDRIYIFINTHNGFVKVTIFWSPF